MELLNNPDVIYVLLAGGLVFLVLELAAPGTGYLEVITLFVLGTAGWAVVAYGFPINLWALLLLIIGAILFLFAVRSQRSLLLLGTSCTAVVLGSVFLFQGDQPLQPAISPWLAITVSVLSAGLFWIVGRKAAEAISAKPTHDLESLIGTIGIAKSPIYREGSIQAKGELWSAVSREPIQEGRRVRVTGRDGFTLQVEPLEETADARDH